MTFQWRQCLGQGRVNKETGMIKKGIFVVVLISTLLSFKIALAENKKISEAEFFKRKQGCAEMMTSIEAKLKNEDFYVPETDARSINSFKKIFYSPKQNSCLYYATEITYIRNKIEFEQLRLVDALTGENILDVLIEMKDLDYAKQRYTFEVIVKEYEANP